MVSNVDVKRIWKIEQYDLLQSNMKFWATGQFVEPHQSLTTSQARAHTFKPIWTNSVEHICGRSK